jgi:peptidoglycan hydrolase CwlO-like protein
MNSVPRSVPLRILACAVVAAALAAIPTTTAGADSIDRLNSQLSQEQSHQQTLSAAISRLSGEISSLDSQIALVQSREAAVRAELAHDRDVLAKTQVELAKTRKQVAILKARLARAQLILARQLVSNYEGSTPDLVSVVLESNGFSDLLDKLAFLRKAESQQSSIITVTRRAKALADAAEKRLAKLEVVQKRETVAAILRERALEGMNTLLASKQAAAQRARSAQQNAMATSRAKSQQLQSSISKLKAKQAAEQAAAAAQAAATSSTPAGSGTGSGALGPSGGWAIPYSIVLCESGGQNLPPNSAGASGYYQIIPSTWTGFGGTGPAAYLAPKSEQDAVASRIWDHGAGASDWVCAHIVGII